MKRKAIFLLYRVFGTLVSPLLLAYLLLRSMRDRRYLATIGERFGQPPALSPIPPGAIWFHAASVGEVIAAETLIAQLRRRSPRVPVYVSVTTLAGRATAEQRLGGVANGIFFAPVDLVWCVRRVLRRIWPSVLVVLETEIWPNLYREAIRTGAGLLIVNGRISDRARDRYRKWSWFFGPVLRLCDGILTQSDEMSERFVEAGADPEKVSAAGNLKYDSAPPKLGADSPVRAFIAAGLGRPVWIAASTSADGRIEEEDFVLAAQHELVKEGWRLIIAPRKPERFPHVAEKLAASGMRWTRRTAHEDPAADVLLLDTIGELGAVFEFGDVVFMGGTLAEKGGHNVLEPAQFSKAVIAGPHLENFRDIETHFTKANALLRIGRGEEMAAAVRTAAADPSWGIRAGEAAAKEHGASRRIADAVMAFYESRYPAEQPPLIRFFALGALSLIWRIGSARDRAAKQSRARKLPVPVISVGNITAGGTGKTPLCVELLRGLSGAGLLTRGYGRSTKEIVVVPADQRVVPVERTGDEAQIYLRSTDAPIGIGSDRFDAGKALLAKCDAKILLLDDGFQHLQLARDFNLIAIDALNPFGGGHLLPLGRLREPLEGLARADAFVMNRSDEVANVAAIEHQLRRYKPNAPIYRARTALKAWVSASGERLPLDAMRGKRAVLFCGLGNPESFWRSAQATGVVVASKVDFEDHHRYSASDMRRLMRHAKDLNGEVLLSTAKDAVNLDPAAVSIVAPLEIFWLEIGVEIDRFRELLDQIRSVC